jgi:hypothetical protein
MVYPEHDIYLLKHQNNQPTVVGTLCKKNASVCFRFHIQNFMLEEFQKIYHLKLVLIVYIIVFYTLFKQSVAMFISAGKSLSRLLLLSTNLSACYLNEFRVSIPNFENQKFPMLVFLFNPHQA